MDSLQIIDVTPETISDYGVCGYKDLKKHEIINGKHLNSHGTVHGGVIYSLADTAFAVASNSHGIPAVAINTSITYMKAARDGILTAEANEFSKNPKLGSYIVEVYDQDKEKIAIFQGLSYRKTPRK